MSEKGCMSEKGETNATSGKSRMRPALEIPLLLVAPLSRVSLVPCLLLVTRLSPVARRMCASEAHA